MSFRSGINQVNTGNSAPIKTFYQSTITTQGARNEIPITLGVGTYKCSISSQINITGTGSLQLLINYGGLSGINGTTVAVTPQPIEATNYTLLPNQTFNAGNGFSNFQETFISIDSPRTLWLYNLLNWGSVTGTPIVTINQALTITQLI